ncbi:MAG: hypothetical protein E4H23_11425 [Chrysiogenales bacterium]|nr:hypothetical protein [Candidatus Aminicenantes bacterium]TFG74890.1 MAG: hypothetical protein E4H23_11425 [Chrysiogenales bacterium]
MKSKIIPLLLLAGLSVACVESFVSVPIPFSEEKIADFSAYRDVFFIDFVCDIPEADLTAETEIRRTFAEEMPFAIDKKITLLEPDHWAMIRGILRRYRLAVDIQYDNSVFFQKVFQAHPKALFFTGKLKLNIKKMGVVKETRDEMGKKKNAYETVQMWEMEMKVFLIDGDKAKILKQETYTEKLEPGSASAAQFNFNSMFAKMTAKLTAALQPRKALQERFILYK